jgi:AraC-like DNA-binding protein
MRQTRQRLIRSLFDEYIKMYASRDDRLTAHFSKNFSGYTGGGGFLVKDRDEWVKITRQDFAQVTGHVRIEMLNLVMQDLSEEVVVATALFHIHLPIPEYVLSREAVRLTLVFRLEDEDWKIAHSGISVPYYLVREGEVYPIKGLYERNHELEMLLKERTLALQEANRRLDALNRVSHKVRQYLACRLDEDIDLQTIAQALNQSMRTLGRRLKEEGTTFLRIKDELRRDVAVKLLIENKKTVETIAVQIGFSSVTTFHRSFKKWTGTTPLAYQRTRG